MHWYQSAKLEFLAATHLTKDSAHFLVGMAALFGSILLTHRHLPVWRSLLPVLLAGIGMEILDAAGLDSISQVCWNDSLADIAKTVAAPTLLTWVFCLRRRRLERLPRPSPPR